MCCASRKIVDSIGPWQQEDEAEFERDLAISRAALGESVFAGAVEQAVAYALESQN